ncbi:fumarylacetoacetate hydrolase family protein [Streptomyces mirabilis]|uniref:fumarylacetoacetate hydrolase family protein n=1 Tax=Streptomyces mirabilis TaxID=68239 RepID=UPI003646B1D9
MWRRSAGRCPRCRWSSPVAQLRHRTGRRRRTVRATRGLGGRNRRGDRARRVSAADAWSHVAALTVGQDISDRDTQNRPETYPQFGLGKSHPGYSPIGPVLVTPDEFDDPDDIELGCLLNGQEVQKSSTSDLIFSVPQLIEYLSGILTLLPGDLIFTGTPSGVGTVMDPPRYLTSSDEITSWATGIGTMSHTFTEARRSGGERDGAGDGLLVAVSGHGRSRWGGR